MSDNDSVFRGRMGDLDARAESRDTYAYSEFLTLAEQELLSTLPHRAERTLDGGFDGAERKIAVFRGTGCPYEEEPPISLLRVSPKDAKFAQPLAHRDYLGALIGLGIRREVVGDILTDAEGAYVICLSGIADFIRENLTKVSHTDVICAVTETVGEAEAFLPPLSRAVVSSCRLDALVAAVFRLTRSEAQECFSRELVTVNGRTVTSYTDEPAEGAIVSVRGKGRFRYEGTGGMTKKGRISAAVRIWSRSR